jgi:hypothetical protein
MKKIVLLLLCLTLASCEPAILGAQFREGSIIEGENTNQPATQQNQPPERSPLKIKGRISADSSLMKRLPTEGRVVGDSTVEKDVANQAVSVTYFGTQFMSLPGFAPKIPGANLTMGFYSVMDLLKLIADIKEKRNTISARIIYKDPVLFWRVRDGRDLLTPVSLPVSRADADLMRTCNWMVEAKTYKPLITNEKIAKMGDRYGVRDIVLNTKEIYEILHYPAGIDSLPETSGCGRKAAERFLAKMVARRLTI